MVANEAFNTSEQTLPSWTDRATICCDMLRPGISSRQVRTLSDVGCGDQKFKKILSEQGLDVTYRGFDLIPQASDVIRLDLNSNSVPGHADALVVLGVLEYVERPQECLTRLAQHAPILVASHLVRDGHLYSAQAARDRGWKNHLYSQDFAELMTASGWRILERRSTSDEKTRLWLAARAGFRA